MDSPDTPSAHTGGRRLSAGHDGWMDDLLEAGFAVGHELTPVRATLEHTGWMYRGDAGDHGGHVFLLEASPGLRVACLHIVDHESRQWQDYLQLRDLLRHSADARDTYEAVKQRLREQVGDDRDAYTEGKSAIIGGLLSKTGPADRRSGDRIGIGLPPRISIDPGVLIGACRTLKML